MKVGDFVRRRNKSSLRPGKMNGIVVHLNNRYDVDVLWSDGEVSWIHPYRLEVVSESR